MLAYIVRRVLYAIPILIGVNLLTFMLFFVVNNPDDMARMHLGMKHVTQDAIDKAVHWSLGLSNSFLITAGDIQILPMILDAATRFDTPPSDLEMSNLVDAFDMQSIICSIRDLR